jgi:hypothetical protein
MQRGLISTSERRKMITDKYNLPVVFIHRSVNDPLLFISRVCTRFRHQQLSIPNTDHCSTHVSCHQTPANKFSRRFLTWRKFLANRLVVWLVKLAKICRFLLINFHLISGVPTFRRLHLFFVQLKGRYRLPSSLSFFMWEQNLIREK